MMKSELLGYIPFSFLSLQILPIDSFFYILNSIYYGATMFVMVIILKNENISMGEGRVTYDDFMLISFLLHTDDPKWNLADRGGAMRFYDFFSNCTLSERLHTLRPAGPPF